LSYEEVAEATGWSLPSVKSRLFRARETLKGAMRAEFESGGAS